MNTRRASRENICNSDKHSIDARKEKGTGEGKSFIMDLWKILNLYCPGIEGIQDFGATQSVDPR